MNNKGFAITSIIYSLMLLFVVIITSFLSILIGRNRRIDELKKAVYDTLDYETMYIELSDFENDNNAFVTPEKGLYYFTYNDCLTFLPKSVVLITDKLKNPSAGINELYYYYNYNNMVEDGGKNIDDYKNLTSNCLNK